MFALQEGNIENPYMFMQKASLLRLDKLQRREKIIHVQGISLSELQLKEGTNQTILFLVFSILYDSGILQSRRVAHSTIHENESCMADDNIDHHSE